MVPSQKDKDWFGRRIRRIHMDFHNPEVVPELLIKHFDAKKYVALLKAAHVNSLVTFTKCHHGNAYYQTRVGHVHSGLPPGIDMFGQILDECHKNGIKVIAYYSVMWDNYIGYNHPGWRMKNKDGSDYVSSAYKNICLNSPYPEKIVLPQLREIAENYPVDGLWLDIVFALPCYCKACQEKYKNQCRADLLKDDSHIMEFVRLSRKHFLQNALETIKSINPNIPVSYNGAGESRDLAKSVDYLTIETHPGAAAAKGGWILSVDKYKLMQSCRMPFETCTDRFLHGWGAFDIQTLENMKITAAQIMAHGGVINLGDQAYPTGELEPGFYAYVEKLYSYVMEREEWCIGSLRVPYVALLRTARMVREGRQPTAPQELGAVKMLLEKHWHFDILAEEIIDELPGYQVLVVPDSSGLKNRTVDAIVNFVKKGGGLLISGQAGLDIDRPQANFPLSQVLGIDFAGRSKYSTGYLECTDRIDDGIPSMPLLLISQFLNIKPKTGTEILARVRNPIIESQYPELIFRSRLSPPGKISDSPGIVLNRFGKGKAAYIAAPVFSSFWNENSWYLRNIVNNVLNLVVPEKLIELDAPMSVTLNVTEKKGKVIVHLINYHAEKESGLVEELLPVKGITIRLSKKLVKPAQVLLIPGEQKLKGTDRGDIFEVRIPELKDYSLVIFEKSDRRQSFRHEECRTST